jgi:hypothetical protein
MLLWYSRCGRFDISFAVGSVSKRVLKWSKRAQRALKRIAGYVKFSRFARLRMRFHPEDTLEDLECTNYVDADWRFPKSQTGAVVTATSGRGSYAAVEAISPTQTAPADSTPVAEVFAQHAGVKLAINVSQLIWLKYKIVHCRGDNTTAGKSFRQASSAKLAPYARIVKLKLGLLKFCEDHGIAKWTHIRSAINPANILTKQLGPLAHAREAELLGIYFPPNQPGTVGEAHTLPDTDGAVQDGDATEGYGENGLDHSVATRTSTRVAGEAHTLPDASVCKPTSSPTCKKTKHTKGNDTALYAATHTHGGGVRNDDDKTCATATSIIPKISTGQI